MLSVDAIFQVLTKPFANKDALLRIYILSFVANATSLNNCTTSTQKVHSCFMFQCSSDIIHILLTLGCIFHVFSVWLGTCERYREKQRSGQNSLRQFQQPWQQRQFHHVLGAIEQGRLFWHPMRGGWELRPGRLWLVVGWWSVGCWLVVGFLFFYFQFANFWYRCSSCTDVSFVSTCDCFGIQRTWNTTLLWLQRLRWRCTVWRVLTFLIGLMRWFALNCKHEQVGCVFFFLFYFQFSNCWYRYPSCMWNCLLF